MKILLCHNHYQQPGGEQLAVEGLEGLLRSKGHQVIPYYENNAAIAGYSLWDKFQFLANTVYSRKTYRAVRGIVEDQRPEVAHVHNVFPLISPSIYCALRDAGVPIVQTVHNFRLMCPNGLFYTRGMVCERCKLGNTVHAIRRRCYRHSYVFSALYAFAITWHRKVGTFEAIDRFIALTGFSARKLVEGGLAPWEKIAVLGNFVAEPLPAPGSFSSRDPYVVYLGRLSPEKGVEILLQAMSTLPHLRLKILGDGPLAETMSSFVRRQRMSNIEFLGYVVGPAKLDLIRRALASVMPSTCYENFPLAVIESLSLGTPVVVSDTGSLPYVLENGQSGLVFRSGDSHDLASKLDYLASYPEEALIMGQKGLHEIRQKYCASAHYEGLMRVYQGVLN